MKNLAAVFVLLLFTVLSHAHNSKVYGTVKNEDGSPVELCVVKAVHSDYFTQSNRLGEFSLEYNSGSSDSVVFLCLGYESKDVRIDNDTLRVVLHRKANVLNEVTVQAENTRRKIKHGIMGKRNLKPFGIFNGSIGDEAAILLRADSSRHGTLENIYFYIFNEGLPDSRFRAHVYDIDTAFWPGADLVDTTLILHANKGNEWVSADLSSRHIPVGRGVFVSLEWISGYGNVETKVKSKTYPAQPAFNGPVLSGTEGYYKQGYGNYRRHKNGDWGYISSRGSSWKNNVNLMVYATYTYRKK
jgi:hypothetical protein